MPTYFLNLTGGLTTRDVSTQDVSHIFIGFISLRPVEGWNLQYRYRNTTIINAYSSDKGGRILWHVRIQSITQNSAKSLVFSLFPQSPSTPTPCQCSPNTRATWARPVPEVVYSDWMKIRECCFISAIIWDFKKYQILGISIWLVLIPMGHQVWLNFRWKHISWLRGSLTRCRT